MSWLCPLALYIVVGRIFLPINTQYIARDVSLTRNLLWQFLFTTVFSVLFFIRYPSTPDWRMAVVFVIGIFVAFGCYCSWRAVNISMHRAYIMTWADDLTALGLGYVFLGESRFLSPVIAVGVIVSIASAIIYSLRNKEKTGLYFWIAAYSLIWGLAFFSKRYFALTDLPVPAFTVAWYSGAFLGAVIIFRLRGKEEAGEKLNTAQKIRVFIQAILISVSLALSCWVMSPSWAPLTIFQPIDMVAEMTLPVIIGLTLFKEYRDYEKRPTRLEWLIMAIGLIGSLLIVWKF